MREPIDRRVVFQHEDSHIGETRFHGIRYIDLRLSTLN